MTEDRTKYLFYRCFKCGRGMTCLEMIRKWEKAERSDKPALDLCTCGSRQFAPGNPKLWEELFRPSIWKLFYVKVFLPWLKAKLSK